VTLILHAAAGPEQGDRRIVDPKLLEQIWQASSRTGTRQPAPLVTPSGLTRLETPPLEE
jgi:hypothetical protein